MYWRTSALYLSLAINKDSSGLGPSYQVRVTQMSFISSPFREMFSVSKDRGAAAYIRLISCCYFVFESRVNTVIRPGPILTQQPASAACSGGGSLTKYVQHCNAETDFLSLILTMILYPHLTFYIESLKSFPKNQQLGVKHNWVFICKICNPKGW